FNIPVETSSTPVHGGSLAIGHPMLRVEGEGIDVTAVKQCEERESLLVRLVNLSAGTQRVTVGLGGALAEAYRLNLAEERKTVLTVDGDRSVQIEVKTRQILSVELVPAR